MARVAFPLVLQSPSTGSAIAGATATITVHEAGITPGTGAAASIYTSETATGPIVGNQIQTDDTGRWTQGSGSGYAQYWLPQGTYDVQVSGTGLTTYTITRELFSAGQSDEVILAGELKFWPGVSVPNGFLRADGTAYSRTGYPNLFAALTLQTSGNLTDTSDVISGMPESDVATLSALVGGLSSGFAVPVSGSNIPSGAYIVEILSSTSVLMNQEADGTSTGQALTIAPHGVGDGATTFNVPNLSGRSPFGQVPSGGGTGAVLGSDAGASTATLTLGQLPAHSHTIPTADTGVGVQASDTGISIGSGQAQLYDPGHVHYWGYPVNAEINYSGSNTVISGGSGQSESTSGSGTGIYDTGHGHGVGDPGHAHGITDPGHNHGGVTGSAGASSPSPVSTLHPVFVAPFIIRHGNQ